MGQKNRPLGRLGPYRDFRGFRTLWLALGNSRNCGFRHSWHSRESISPRPEAFHGTYFQKTQKARYLVIRVSQVRILWHPPLVTPMNASRVIEPPGFASPGTLTGVLEGLIL